MENLVLPDLLEDQENVDWLECLGFPAQRDIEGFLDLMGLRVI